MATLQKKPVQDSIKVEHQDSVKMKVPPVKVVPKGDNVGGIFSTKLIAIWKKILGKE